jgi:CRP-like cAMP-binding protein
MTNLIHVLRQVAPLKDEECEKLMKITKTIHLKKGEFWIESGKSNKMIAFIAEGYLRKYYVKDGDEITDFFYFENDFSSDLPSILTNTPPHANAVAMKKTTLIAFTYEDFNNLCLAIPAFEHLHRLIIQHTFIKFYTRTMSFILKNPKERYDDLVAHDPRILQNATQYHIASYLGISPQHLSRLRSEF